MKRITNPDNNMWRSTDPPQRTERVAARIGGGGLKVIDREHGLSDKSGSVFKQSLEQINDRHLENNDIECIANGLSSNDKLTIDMNEVPERLQAKLRVNYSEFRHTIADAQSIHHNEPDVYFYHSDHLGSASWITDNGGLAVQHLQYLPYGERYVDQRISGYSERFTFTGKERDEETGYNYHGARYYDAELMTSWLSVDPMADKYPSISPYAYCAWNPVKLVDPDGREIWIIGEDGNRYQYKRGKLYSEDGSRYKGNDKFANKVRKDLRKLERKGIKSEINEMASHENKHIIIKRTNGDNTATAENSILETNGVGCGTTIGYNPNLKSNNDGMRKEHIGLAHELGHAYNSFCGDVDNTDLPVERVLNRVNHSDGTYSEEYQQGNIKMNEIYAVKFENRVRGKNEQRYTYDKFNIGKYL